MSFSRIALTRWVGHLLSGLLLTSGGNTEPEKTAWSYQAGHLLIECIQGPTLKAGQDGLLLDRRALA